MSLGDIQIAIVHDELIRRGGAEHVLEEMLRVFPQAHVYALYAGNNPYMTVDKRPYLIRTTFLQKFPLWFRRHPRRLAPLLLHAAERIDLSNYDLVISSSSAFAKGVITRSNIPHISYCHTPTRYLWEYSSSIRMRGIGRFGQHMLRIGDFAAAQRPDVFIANSQYTADRVATYYRCDSHVLYPPVQTDMFYPASPHTGSHNQHKRSFLCVGRLTPAKMFDQAIQVCEKLQIPLKIVGAGHDRARLQKLAGRYTEFLGKVSDGELCILYRNADAVLQPGVEDFGIASVEALACGTPVIAVGQGGVQEIITSNTFGILYRDALPELLADAIRQFLERSQPYYPSLLQQHAMKFSRSQFQRGLKNIVEDVLASRQN